MRIDLLRHWGPTGRDITLKSAKFKSELSTKPLSYYQNFKSDVQILSMPIPELWSDIRQLHEQTKKEAVLPGSSKQRTELQDKLTYTSGLKNSFKRHSPTVDIKNSSHNALQKIPTNESRAAFLRGAHRAACKIFGTVLGPEANDAHRDHFHVDLAPRRYENYCR
ncbi:MAG: extensin family protein [Hyphomicrobiaceae bacterium]|nr:extensin family protein [Hyphomicrobiaceae bacterium]